MYSIRTLLVPTDLSPADGPVLARAFELARPAGARVHLLHVFDSLLHDLPLGDAESDATRALRVRMRGVAHDALHKLAAVHAGDGVRITAELRLAPEPAPSIVACACDITADLIVMGTRGHVGLRRMLFGSVSAAVAARRPCPVEVVGRAPEEGSWSDVLGGMRERMLGAWV